MNGTSTRPMKGRKDDADELGKIEKKKSPMSDISLNAGAQRTVMIKSETGKRYNQNMDLKAMLNCQGIHPHPGPGGGKSQICACKWEHYPLY